MKIRPRVFKYQQGRKFLKDLIDFDPKNYTSEYDNVLVDADFTDDSWNPWESKLQGTAPRRYVPTPHGTFGENKDHYTYTKGVEQTPYYLLFTRDLLDENGKFTPVGEQWARAVDALIPNGEATFYDPNTGQLRTQWNVTTKDSHGRKPVNFTKLSDYVNAIRNDLILGARHNVFRKRGKRYFYIDKNGTKHWVNPNDIEGFTVSENPVESGYSDDKTTWWDDYQLTEPGENPLNPLNPENPYGITGQHNDKYGFDWDKAKQYVNKYLPDLISAGRLLGNINNNNRVFREMEAGIRPNLMQPYLTHRQVVGDEGTKLAYYRRGVLGLTKAGRAVTSNMDLQIAYLMEAKRAADELRALGDLADNQEIRRTSDESNQHLWANAQRRAEVANNNVVAINKANYDWHQLEAGRKSANWTSFDNWLLGKETKLEKEKLRKQAILDLIWTLDEQNKMQNDELLLDAYNNLSTIYDLVAEEYKKENKTTSPANDPRVKEAKRAYDLRKYLLQKQLYYDMLNRPLSAKSGMKFTFKSKDDLLYKTARDAAYHFKDMVNLTIKDKKKTPKAPKLVPHPKGNAKKYLQGGTAPFTIYRPATVGGEQSIQSSSDDSINSRSSKSSKLPKDETLDVIKDLFKNLEGLPSDVNGVYQSMSEFLAKSKLFGNELSTEDIASMYLQQMQLINNIKFSKAAYDKAKEEATKNEALNEFAVDGSGKVAVQNRDTGKIDFKSWSDVKENLDTFNPLTNNDLLNLRAYTKDLQFLDLLFNVINNGIGVTKIADFIKSHLPSLGNSEQTIEGYTKKQSNQIRQGFELLLQDAPDGDYHYSRKTQDLKEQIKMALGYIKTILPRNMKAVLNIHADMQGVSPDDMLKVLLGSESTTINDLKLTAITGKGAKGSGNGDGLDDDKIKTNPLLAMQREIGGVPQTYNLVTRDSNTKMSVNGTFYSALPKVNDDMSVDKMLSESGIAGILDSKYGITFGDQHIDPANLKDIMYSNTGGMVVTLPCKVVNGHKEVNLGVRETYEKCVLNVLSKGILNNTEEYYRELGKELLKEGLTSLLKNGLPDKNKFAQFLVVEAYATDKNIGKNIDFNSLYVEKVANPDENLEQRLIRALSTNDKKDNYSLDVDYWLWGDDVYRATMFIPLTNNANAAMNSWGNSDLKLEQLQDLEEQYQIFNKSANFNKDNSLE